MRRRLLVIAAVAFGVLVFSSTAGAATLGITAPPSGAVAEPCGVLAGEATSDPSTSFTVPTGGGEITQWQTYTASDTAGATLTFVVLRPTSGSHYAVVGLDAVTLPNPLPTDNIASFTPSSPIQVQAGDILALYTTDAICAYADGSTPADDSVFVASGVTPPTIGEGLGTSGTVGPSFIMNVAATLSQTVDAGVTTSTFPSTTSIASAALLSSVVTNGGPNVAPITFVDHVPSGLQIQSATAGMGTCTVGGQTVTCTITGLLAGQSTTVNVAVTAAKAGSYANDVTVSVPSGVTDPNSANNIASASLDFTKLPQKCIVPGLRKTALAPARTLLKELGCRVGVAHQYSTIKKGLVISTRPGVGTYPYQQKVTLVVSSGKKPKKKK
jgi:hypothetical protein